MMSELPKGWVGTTLGEVCSKPQYGYTTKADPVLGEVKFLRTTDITKGLLNWDTVPFCMESPSESSKYQLVAGDIVIARSGSVGVSYLIDKAYEPAVFASYLIRFKPITPVLSQYVKAFLDSHLFWKQVEVNKAGNALQNINAQKLSAMSFPLAPLAEQKRIVEKLDEVLAQVDTIKARLDGIPALLKRFRQSVLVSAVSGKLTEEWRRSKNFDLDEEIDQIKKSREQLYLRDNAEHFEKTGKNLRKYDYSTLYEDPEFRVIPDSWSLVQLGGLISLLTDYHANGSYEVLKEHVELKETEDYACMIRATNFEKNNFEDLFVYISQDAYNFLSKSKLYGNEILVGKIGNAGSVYFMPQLGRPASLAMNLFALRFDDELVSPEYLYMFLKSSIGERNIQKYVRGVATKSIDKKSLRSVFVNYPPLEEQKEIVRLVDQYFAFADTIEAQVKKAQAKVDNLTQSILAKAFRGELVEQDPSDEPADKLLERIAKARADAEALAKAAKKAEAAKKRAEKAAAKG